MASSPTQHSLELMRGDGFRCAITERWNPFAKIRQDLFGFCDILCIHPVNQLIIAVQTTTYDHAQERIDKIMGLEESGDWLGSGGLIQVHGWKKMGPRGKRKVWTCRVWTVPVAGEPITRTL